MRVILITIVTLLVGCGLLIGNESSASQATQRSSQRFTISRQGTLLELIDADGKDASKKVTGDGFKLKYKTRGKSRSVSAIEMKTMGLRTSSEPVKYDGNKATAVVQTADKALEITSELTFDANTRELIIKRKFRNMSKYPVTLQEIRNYIDPGVVGRGQFNRSAKLISGPLDWMTAGRFGNPPPNGCGDRCECTVPPVCNTCPRDVNSCRGVSRATLYSSQKNVVLEWLKQFTLKTQLPQLSKQSKRSKQPQQSGDEVSIAIKVVIR